ncbi:hypothetical protein GCM10023229_17100 [Flavisolibacter ginsenosidimutans]
MGYLLPYTFYFVLKINGQRLADSTLNNLRLYYLSNGTKNYVYDFGRAGSDGYNLGAMLTKDIGYKSADNNIKDYYLEFSNADIDTLFVDYKHYSICEADTSACYCLYPRLSIKYNGQTASYDPAIPQQQVYLFNK